MPPGHRVTIGIMGIDEDLSQDVRTSLNNSNSRKKAGHNLGDPSSLLLSST